MVRKFKVPDQGCVNFQTEGCENLYFNKFHVFALAYDINGFLWPTLLLTCFMFLLWPTTLLMFFYGHFTINMFHVSALAYLTTGFLWPTLLLTCFMFLLWPTLLMFFYGLLYY